MATDSGTESTIKTGNLTATTTVKHADPEQFESSGTGYTLGARFVCLFVWFRCIVGNALSEDGDDHDVMVMMMMMMIIIIIIIIILYINMNVCLFVPYTNPHF
jgi:hypothetical protein